MGRPALLVLVATAVAFGWAAAPATVATRADEVTVGPADAGRTITLSRRETLHVPRPFEYEEWRIRYAPGVLRLLTPAGQVRRPGPDGWRFEAIAPGRSAMAFVAIVDRGARRSGRVEAQAPAEPHLTFTVIVR